MGNFLRLTIDEYAIPAFCSSYKYMFGTLDDMKIFIDGLRNIKKCTSLIEAFDKYLAGDTKVKYDVAYNQMQLMHNCICFDEREDIITDFSYLFEKPIPKRLYSTPSISSVVSLILFS